MKIPFQDTRADGDMRWTDYRKLKCIRFRDIYDLIDGCIELDRHELEQINELIRKKIDSPRP